MTFHSVHHPGTTPRLLLALQAQARPVALALLAVMTVGLAAALRGEAIFWPFVGAFAVAYVLAVAVGQGRLHRDVAEIDVRGPFASVLSVWDAAAARPAETLEPVVSARLAYDALHVGIGDTVRTFERPDWPLFDDLVAALRASAREGDRLLSEAAYPIDP